MNKISGHEFFEMTNGKVIDVDGAYGGQCWDLFAFYCQKVLGRAFSCVKTGYVADLWNYFDACGLSPYFEKVTGNYQDGDWLLWTQPCFCTDSSHIAMFRCDNGNGTMTVLSQNPGATRQYAWPYSGLTGALRLKPQYTYEGNFEEVTQQYDNKYLIKGWFWDGTDDTSQVHIYIRKDGINKFVDGVNCNIKRDDLITAKKGNGCHGFEYIYDFDNLGAGTYDITVYQIRHDGNNQPLGTRSITIDKKVVEPIIEIPKEEPIITEPVIVEPTPIVEVPIIDEIEPVVEVVEQEPTNTTEDTKKPKKGIVATILGIGGAITYYLQEHWIMLLVVAFTIILVATILYIKKRRNK